MTTKKTGGSLRPVTEADLPLILEWRNSPRIRQRMFHSQAISWEEHLRWYERNLTDDAKVFLLYEDAGKPVGAVQFTVVDRTRGHSLWGFYVGPEDSPKGTGLRLGTAGLDCAFGPLGLRKVNGEVQVTNLPSRNFHKKLGFSQEGVLHQQVLKDGNHCDVVIFSLSQTAWRTRRLELDIPECSFNFQMQAIIENQKTESANAIRNSQRD